MNYIQIVQGVFMYYHQHLIRNTISIVFNYVYISMIEHLRALPAAYLIFNLRASSHG
jgi:hypothetical protein